ncbi:transmembrane protein, putative [Medicago truncatula]|uniref:Transmembrane protein, putative n=1 Tax=Medicago truncatula TaxID=3880 RepID=A0A072UBY0_MEDTR|nr:transmembrane protein, putative [Medicago truncatula]
MIMVPLLLTILPELCYWTFFITVLPEFYSLGTLPFSLTMFLNSLLLSRTVLRLIEKIMLKFHEKGSMTQVHVLNPNI